MLAKPRRRLAAGPGSRKQLRHRLNRKGNRQLNLALHRLAVTEARVHAPARAHLTRRQAEGGRGVGRCLGHAAGDPRQALTAEGGAPPRGATAMGPGPGGIAPAPGACPLCVGI
jgi:hypothetical protein